jgi:hypothetical protein
VGCTTFFLLISQAKQQPEAEFQRKIGKHGLKQERKLQSRISFIILAQDKYKTAASMNMWQQSNEERN